jgi:Flp pilus assembly protein TadD
MASARAFLVFGLVLLLSAGCGRQPSRAESEAAKQVRAQALIDAGNEAFRAGDYRLAARRYAAAAVVKKDDPAAFFGMGMTLSRLGRDEDARVAYARARALTLAARAAADTSGVRRGRARGRP